MNELRAGSRVQRSRNGRIARVLGLMVVSGCAADAPSAPAPPVARDSAGVRIVENTVPQWQRGFEWKLSSRPIVSIEPDEDALEDGPLDPAAAFIMAGGDIVLLDGMFGGWNRGLVYDSAGRFVRHLGRKGNGPCEFQQIFGGARYRGDSVAVFDFARTSLFIMGLDGGCGRVVPIPRTRPQRTPQRAAMFSHQFFGVHYDGSFAFSPYGIAYADGGELTWSRHPVMKLDAVGDGVHALGEFELTEVALDPNAPYPLSRNHFYNREVLVRPYEAGIVLSDNARLEVHVHDAAGTLTFIARRPHTPVRVTDADKRTAVAYRPPIAGGAERSRARAPTKSVEQRIAEVTWPEFRPAQSDLRIDEHGNFWLEEYRFPYGDQTRQDPASTFWSVLDRDGVWLGRVEVPGRLLVERIYDDRIIGIWKHADGNASIRVYRLDKPGQ